MMTLLTASALALTLTDWSSHGEIKTEVARKMLAINHTLINAINADPGSTWKAGVNSRFVGATLAGWERRANPPPAW